MADNHIDFILIVQICRVEQGRLYLSNAFVPLQFIVVIYIFCTNVFNALILST